MRRLAILLFAAAAAMAGVDGTVVNGTTGQPQPNTLITLYRLGGTGMEPVKSLKSDAEGTFRFEQDVQGPRLLQVIFDGVLYNQMISPGGASSGLRLEVFNSSRTPGEAKIIQHMILFEPTEGRLQVTENFFFRNPGKLSFNDPANGTVRFFLPEAAEGQARVMATAPGGMPVERSASKTPQPNVYKIDFPIKPGETRFDVSYSLPFSTPGVFAGRSLGKDAPLRLVVPSGVTLNGEGLKPLGQEPASGASIFEVGGGEYKVEIQGSGALGSAGAGADEEESGPGIEQILPRVYSNVYWILGLSLAILLLGFVLLYRRASETPSAPTPQARNPRGSRR